MTASGFDIREVLELQRDLGKVPGVMVEAVTGAVESSGEALMLEWASNARETSGAHGVWYPDSVDYEMKFGLGSIGVEVGPNSAKKQGSMGRGFEYGSANQPPHMDGHRAADIIEPRFDRALDAAFAYGMRPLGG